MALAIVIWVLCLIPIFPETPLDGISFIDKWTHLVMYGTFTTVIWWEYLKQRGARSEALGPKGRFRSEAKKEREEGNASSLFTIHSTLYTFIAPILMSGLIELAQAYCTAGHRSGEWLDFAANTFGVVLGTIVGYSCSMVLRHRQKG